jgi:hypothetical protein
VVQPVQLVSAMALRTSAHGRSSSSLVMSVKVFLARLKPLTSNLTARGPKARIHSPGWPYFQWLPMS